MEEKSFQSRLFLGCQSNRVLPEVGVLSERILGGSTDEKPISNARVTGDQRQHVKWPEPRYSHRRRLTFRCPERVRPGHINGKATAWFRAAAPHLPGKTNRGKGGGDNGSDGRRLTSGRSHCENRTFCYVLLASHPLSTSTGPEREELMRNAGISVGGEGVVLAGVGRGEAAGGVYGFGLND